MAIRRKPDIAFKTVGGVTEQVTEQVQRLLTALIDGPASSTVLMGH